MSDSETDFTGNYDSDCDYFLPSRLKGINPDLILDKILSAIDQGATTQDIRSDPFKYIVSGQTKEIVICTGGEGLKVSYQIIQEMATRGDKLAILLIKNDKFNQLPSYSSEKSDDPNANRWCYLEKRHSSYDRENPILIEILKENKLHNIGGWTLRVCEVYVEPWSYKVRKSSDHWGSEYVEGAVRKTVIPSQ